MVDSPDFRSYFFERQKQEFNRCLSPGMTCEGKAIRAHSIQNSTVLDLLCRDGHVKALTKRVNWELGPQISFEDVGRNKASTFTGFCAQHDADIFRPIDTAPLDVADPEQLFLLAYRAVAREAQASYDAACKIQSAYQKRVEHGLDDPNAPSPAGMLATQQMIRAYMLYRYKIQYDFALHVKKFEAVRHRIFTLTVARPTIAVSALFSLDNVQVNDEWVDVAMTIIPLASTQTVAIFSYVPDHEAVVTTELQRLFLAQGHYQKYELSKLILNYCENFVIAPDHFDTWSNEKVEAIRAYFLATLTKGNMAFEEERLYLF